MLRRVLIGSPLKPVVQSGCVMTKRRRRAVIGAAVLCGLLGLVVSLYYGLTWQVQGEAEVWEDLESRDLPRFFREALPRQAVNIQYYYDVQMGYGQAVFWVSEREFLAWVAKRVWRVTRIPSDGIYTFSVNPLLPGKILRLKNGYEAYAKRDGIEHVVRYSKEDCTAYYTGAVGH